eukprot:EG_transcript_1744
MPPLSYPSSSPYGPLSSSAQFRTQRLDDSGSVLGEGALLEAMRPPRPALSPIKPIHPLADVVRPPTPSRPVLPPTAAGRLGTGEGPRPRSPAKAPDPAPDRQAAREATARRREERRQRRRQQQAARARHDERERQREEVRWQQRLAAQSADPEALQCTAAARARLRRAEAVLENSSVLASSITSAPSRPRKKRYRAVPLPACPPPRRPGLRSSNPSLGPASPWVPAAVRGAALTELRQVNAELDVTRTLVAAAERKLAALKDNQRLETPKLRVSIRLPVVVPLPHLERLLSATARLPQAAFGAPPALPGLALLLQSGGHGTPQQREAAACIQRAVRVRRARRAMQERWLARHLRVQEREHRELECHGRELSAVPIQTLIRGFIARCILPRKRLETVVKTQTARHKAALTIHRWWRRLRARPDRKAFREAHLSDPTRGVEETAFEDIDEALLAEHIPDSSDSEASAPNSRSGSRSGSVHTASSASRPQTSPGLPGLAPVGQPTPPEGRPASRAATVMSVDPAPLARLLNNSGLRVQSQAMLSKAPLHAGPIGAGTLASLLDLPSAEEIMSWGAGHRDAAPLLTHPGGIRVDGDDPIGAKLMTLLAITYHNIAVEEEHLGDFQRCLISYRVATLTAEDALGPRHSLAMHLRAAWERSQRALGEREKLRALTASGRVILGPRAKRNQWAQRQKAAVASANLTTRPITGGSVLRSTEERKPAKVVLTRMPINGPPSTPELERRMEEVAKHEQHALNQVERQLEAAASYAPLDPEVQAVLRQLQVMRRRQEKEMQTLDLRARTGTERTPHDGGQEKWQLWQRQAREKRALLHSLRGLLLTALGHGSAADEPAERLDASFSAEHPTAPNVLQSSYAMEGEDSSTPLAPLRSDLQSGGSRPSAPSPASQAGSWQRLHPWEAGDMPLPPGRRAIGVLATVSMV